MITDIKPDYITVMVLLFVMIQCRFSDTIFNLQADKVSESRRGSVFISLSVERQLGRFLLPSSPGFFIEQMLVAKVMDLPGPVRERHQMGWGFPVTADLLYLHVHRGPGDCCSKSACNATTLPSAQSKYVVQTQRGRLDPLISKPHFVLGLWKSYSCKAETLHSNT